MASNIEFVNHVVDQLSGAGSITTKRMFGEYGLYCDGQYFAAICDNRLLLKVTDGGKALLKTPAFAPPYEGGKPMLLIEQLEDKELLAQLVKTTCAELPALKPKKPPKKSAEKTT